MQTIENDSAVIPFPATNTEDAPQSNYQPVRYNAMKHGIRLAGSAALMVEHYWDVMRKLDKSGMGKDGT